MCRIPDLGSTKWSTTTHPKALVTWTPAAARMSRASSPNSSRLTGSNTPEFPSKRSKSFCSLALPFTVFSALIRPSSLLFTIHALEKPKYIKNLNLKLKRMKTNNTDWKAYIYCTIVLRHLCISVGVCFWLHSLGEQDTYSVHSYTWENFQTPNLAVSNPYENSIHGAKPKAFSMSIAISSSNINSCQITSKQNYTRQRHQKIKLPDTLLVKHAIAKGIWTLHKGAMLQHTSLILPLPHDRLPSSLTQTRLVDLEWSCRTNGDFQNDEKPGLKRSVSLTETNSELAAQASTLSCLPLGFLGGFLSPTDALYVAKLHIASLPRSTEGHASLKHETFNFGAGSTENYTEKLCETTSKSVLKVSQPLDRKSVV